MARSELCCCCKITIDANLGQGRRCGQADFMRTERQDLRKCRQCRMPGLVPRVGKDTLSIQYYLYLNPPLQPDCFRTNRNLPMVTARSNPSHNQPNEQCTLAAHYLESQAITCRLRVSHGAGGPVSLTLARSFRNYPLGVTRTASAPKLNHTALWLWNTCCDLMTAVNSCVKNFDNQLVHCCLFGLMRDILHPISFPKPTQLPHVYVANLVFLPQTQTLSSL
jgi:hypothetical protein